MKNSIFFLKSLLEGYRVSIGERTYLLCHTDSGELDLAILAHDQNNQEVFLRNHISLGEFISLAERITEAEKFRIVASMTLTEMKRRL